MPSFLTQKGVSNIKNKIESAFVQRAWLGRASSEDGTIIGVATLDRAGLIPSTQLPSYVDDTIEAYFNGTNFYSDSAFTKQINGETGKIYVNIAENEYSNRTYRWSGSQYIEISKQLALGRDAYSAFRGDWGATLESYFSGGKAKQAIADENGNNIVSTYMPFAGGIFTGDVTHNANLILTNSKVIVGKDTSGSNVSLLSINTSNQVVIAYGAHNKFDTLIYGNRIIAYGDVCGQKGVSAKGIADFGLISGSGGGGGTAYTLNIVPSDSKVSIQLKGADGSSDTKEISIFSTSQAGIVAKAPSVGSVLRGNGWGTLAFSELASKPTTISGYGITDAYTKSQIENGIFPNMRVGLADDLGDIEETLDEEYTFQPTANPNEIRDGYAQIESLKGNSLVWNQLLKSSSFTLNSGLSNLIENSTLTVTNHYIDWKVINNFSGRFWVDFTFNANCIIGHKYIVLSNLATNINYTLYYYGVVNSISATVSQGFLSSHIFKYNNTNQELALFTDNRNVDFTTGHYLKGSIQLIDLTQMFGEGNEPTTVEEFYARCPKGMSMDYNEGEVIHFNGDIKSVGFNQWDEEWENGALSSTGVQSGGTRIVTKNFIPILGGKSYYISGARLLYHEYDKDRNHLRIGNNNSFIGPKASFTASPDAHYIKFYTAEAYGTTYNNDICINLSDPDKNGTYEPYTEFRRDLPTDLFEGGMKSAGTAYDEVYWDEAKRTNVKVQRFGKVDLGSLTWRIGGTQNGTPRFHANSDCKIATKESKKFNAICDRYTAKSPVETYSNIIGVSHNIGESQIIIFDSAYTDVESFKAAMSGVMLYYELEEPIVEEIDIPYMDYQVSNDGTEEIVSDVPTTPIKARVTYNFDTVGTVRQNRFDVSTIRSEGVAKLKTPRTIWGQSFDGSGNVDGDIKTTGEVFLDNNRSIRMKGTDGTDYNVLFKSGTDLNIGYDSPVIRFGSSKIFISPSGNVGIGTVDPQFKLDVNGSFKATSGEIDSTSSKPLKINSTHTTTVELILSHKSSNKIGLCWDTSNGVFIFSYVNNKYLGIKDDGTPYFYDNGSKTLLHSGNTSLVLEKTGTDVTGFNLEVNDVEVGISEITDAEINEIFSSWNV